MIPRTKVNYGLRELLRAWFIGQSGASYSSTLLSTLRAVLGTENILLTPSGRAALYFILRAIDKPRIIVPAYTCNAVMEAVRLCGKEIVFVDTEEDGFNMCVSALKKEADERSAVIATHQFGIPCDIESVRKICTGSGAVLIEDAAASLGSRTGGKLTGTFGDLAFFSFDSTKLINVPLKGGAISARDSALFERIRDIYLKEIERMPPLHKVKLLLLAAVLVGIQSPMVYRIFHTLVFRMRGRFTAETAKLNPALTAFYRYDLAEWQAYIAAPQAKHIDRLIEKRRSLYRRYLEELSSCRAFKLPPPDKAQEWACIRFPIRITGDKFAFYRKAVGLGVDLAFSFTYVACPGEFINAVALAGSVLDLPFYEKLSETEFRRVVAALKKIDAEANGVHQPS